MKYSERRAPPCPKPLVRDPKQTHLLMRPPLEPPKPESIFVPEFQSLCRALSRRPLSTAYHLEAAHVRPPLETRCGRPWYTAQTFRERHNARGPDDC